MKTVWGQEVSVGTLVYRGARSGSSSEYKVGVVQSFSKGKPRVNWLYEQSGKWFWIGDERVWYAYPSALKNSFGSPAPESIVPIDVDLEELERQSGFFEQLKYDTKFVDQSEFDYAFDNWRNDG
ncbi:hypothetical protein HWB76_gp166 [Streptomyces phage Blueeyedbeauty]|uniref:Uncharacterized protein n=1 Tax=Streptomyces phage Blueeyedbeauty TaxID=2250336 RepID=A0A345L1T4_9CAUD|nr:hypothetical protein HWB76_gp166 [Streptomyces phage Blueeyedbeauty]AXH49236.1 hypothetical protein SEA_BLUEEYEDBEAUTY_101 [Streptomyces phage Blueeyedbeauty]